MHPRQKAKIAFKNILLGNPQPADPLPPVYPISEVGNRVFMNRPTPLWPAEIPVGGGAICIYMVSGTAKNNSQPKTYFRTARIIVEVVVQHEDNADAIIDSICEKIENLVLHQRFIPDPAFDYLGVPYTGNPEEDPANTADDLVMVDDETVLVAEHVEMPIISHRIGFDIHYQTSPDYAVATHNFDKLHTQWEQDGIESDNDAGNTYRTGIHQP